MSSNNTPSKDNNGGNGVPPNNDTTSNTPTKRIFRIPTAKEVQEREAAKQKTTLNLFKPSGSPIQPPSFSNQFNVPSVPPPSFTTSSSNSSSTAAISTTNTRNVHQFGPPNTTQFANPPPVQQPVIVKPKPKPAVISSSASSSSAAAPGAGSRAPTVVISSRQRGNPLIKAIRLVPWEYGEIQADYQVGKTAGILFLSLKYHRLHPEYIYERMKLVSGQYALRILLCLVDVDDHQSALRELTKVTIINNFTLILAWSNEEAARYIETYKSYENKPPDLIKPRPDSDTYISKLTEVLTQIKSVNKTDVMTLATTFGSLKKIMNASVEEIGLCPGFGETKVRRVAEAFETPFLLEKKKRRVVVEGAD